MKLQNYTTDSHSDFYSVMDICNKTVDYGIKKGADYIEARTVCSEDETVAVLNGFGITVQHNSASGIGIRVIKDGGLAFGSVNHVTDFNIIKNTVDRLIRMAKSLSPFMKRPVKLSGIRPVKDEWNTPVKKSFWDIDPSDKLKLLKNLDRRLRKDGKASAGTNAAPKMRILGMILYTDLGYNVNSDGSSIFFARSLPALMCMYSAVSHKKGSEQRFLAKGASAGYEWLEDPELHRFFVEDCAGVLRAASEARSVKFDRQIDIVISGEIAGIMAHENVGHPSEGDRIKGREGAQAGESFYKDLLERTEKDGNSPKLGADNVSVIDDPTIPGLPGTYLYDDECVPARRRYLIKNGFLNELLLNREYATVFGTESSAAARSVGYNREPIIRMANTFFAPGDYKSAEELAEDIGFGFYMKSFTEWNIDDRRYQSKYVGLEVYLIENGEITDKMVKRPALELTTHKILGSIDGATDTVEFIYGTCGKGDPMQGIPVAMGGPHMRLRNIRVI